MDGDSLHRRSVRPARTPRSTDYARLLIRRAQLALAGLAVPVAVVVGIGVQSSAPPAPAPAPVRVELAAGSGVGAGPATPPCAAQMQTASGITTDPAALPRRLGGPAAALITVAICWTLLIAAGAVWRRRLAARDLHDWDAGWARVEPRWSGRRV